MIIEEIVLDSSSEEESNEPNQTNGSGINNTQNSAATKSTLKFARVLKNLSLTTRELESFQPELSKRERRKLNTRINSDQGKAGHAHDEIGMIIGTGKDLCDCLNLKCPGCWFPCWTCRSTKCGTECRNNRKYIIECIENEAEGTSTKNPVFNQFGNSQ